MGVSLLFLRMLSAEHVFGVFSSAVIYLMSLALYVMRLMIVHSVKDTKPQAPKGHVHVGDAFVAS